MPSVVSPPSWLAAPGMGLRLVDAAQALGPLTRTIIGNPAATAERICNDSRIIAPGDAFIALTGARDGHDFVAAALQAGAAFVMVSRWPPAVEPGPEQAALIVTDVDAALVRLAQWWRNRHAILTIGIGGGVGKTTTKELSAALLARRYGAAQVLKTPANWNDLRGVSLTLLGLRPQHRLAVLEMGMDRPGEVAEIAALARPRWGVVTAVSATHLEFFADMDALVATERGLVESLPPDGVALLNDNDRLVRSMAAFAPCPVHTYGTLPGTNLRAIRVSSRGTTPLNFVARYHDEAVEVQTQLLGRHLVTSALAALSLAMTDGWSLHEAAAALAEVTIPQRIQLLAGLRASIIIDDTYNASPESMLAALDFMVDWPHTGRRLALLGTMRELGPRSAREHHRLGRRAAARCDALWVTGEERDSISAGARAAGFTAVQSFSDPFEAASSLATELATGDIVLVKASHAVGLDQVVPLLVTDAP